MAKKIVKKVKTGGAEYIIKVTVPKITTAGINLIYFGPRIVIRSAIVLMRTNLFTRIISCLTILALDIADLVRKRISGIQFTRNCILSLLMVLFGTIGWDIGKQWLYIEALGIAADIVGGFIGASIFSVSSNQLLTRLSEKVITTDTQKMWNILNPLIDDYNDEEKLWIKENISNKCIKLMYASKDREEFAKNLIETLHSTYKENTSVIK